jgi:MFS family permease
MLADSGTPNRWRLLRWFISSTTFSVPQAAGPIAFSLVALSLTGDANRGAAIVLAMTLAQVAGAIPVARLGRNWPAATFLRLLVGIRTAALVLIAVLAAGKAPFIWLILAAAVGGSMNGAAHGYLRSVLNALTPAERLPRALGIAATLNELTFVLAPVAASGLGSVSPVFAVLALAGLGAVPILLVPQSRAAPIEGMLHVGGSGSTRPFCCGCCARLRAEPRLRPLRSAPSRWRCGSATSQPWPSCSPFPCAWPPWLAGSGSAYATVWPRGQPC